MCLGRKAQNNDDLACSGLHSLYFVVGSFFLFACRFPPFVQLNFRFIFVLVFMWFNACRRCCLLSDPSLASAQTCAAGCVFLFLFNYFPACAFNGFAAIRLLRSTAFAFTFCISFVFLLSAIC